MAEHSEQNRDQSHERSQAQRQFQDPLADCIPFKQMVELQEHHGFRKRIEEHRERPVERRTGDIGQKRRGFRKTSNVVIIMIRMICSSLVFAKMISRTSPPQRKMFSTISSQLEWMNR